MVAEGLERDVRRAPELVVVLAGWFSGPAVEAMIPAMPFAQPMPEPP